LAYKKKEEKPLFVIIVVVEALHLGNVLVMFVILCRSEGCNQQANQSFRCQGLVEGQFVEDCILDTGCSRNLVRSDLVSKENLILGRVITVQCAHGDTVMCPVASVEIEIQGNIFTVEAGVLDNLPQSVLLGADVPGLKELLKGGEKAHMAVTRGQARRVKQSQPEQHRGENVRASPVSGDVASSVCKEGERQLDSNSPVNESILPPVLHQQESRFEDCVPPVSVGTNLPVLGG